MPDPARDAALEAVIFTVLGWVSVFAMLVIVPFILLFVSAAPSGTSVPAHMEFGESAVLDSSRMVDLP
jgi:hypothetical protein